MGFIYKYTSPNGKSYIGQTIRTPKERANDSYGHGYKGCTAFYNAIVYYGGLQNFQMQVLEEVEDNTLLDELEKSYIKEYDTLVPNGYNIDKGGSTGSDSKNICVCKYSLEGQLLETYPSMTLAAKANNCSISGISEVCAGRKTSLMGFRWSKEDEPLSHKRVKVRKIYCFDEEGFLVKEFESCANAAKYFRIPAHQIYQCAAKKKRKRVNNLIFTYEPYIDWNFYKLKHKKPSFNDHPEME